ncbi:MAG: hypothetical protein HWQ43_32835 [Nostoc sp. JL31]|uniref:hypothetical protein n=1 Tax=Nostoc sp. JL31 TaxID=2815395 RepID=UPI0025DEDA28|nr:hypothetical protein [Nostoc sp. JL31]MBN3893699.1 hypothetical protein [Nostoc sp. JL31]
MDAQSTSGQRKIHYTNGRFGFSVQKRIHRSLGVISIQPDMTPESLRNTSG